MSWNLPDGLTVEGLWDALDPEPGCPECGRDHHPWCDSDGELARMLDKDMWSKP